MSSKSPKIRRRKRSGSRSMASKKSYFSPGNSPRKTTSDLVFESLEERRVLTTLVEWDDVDSHGWFGNAGGDTNAVDFVSFDNRDVLRTQVTSSFSGFSTIRTDGFPAEDWTGRTLLVGEVYQQGGNAGATAQLHVSSSTLTPAIEETSCGTLAVNSWTTCLWLLDTQRAGYDAVSHLSIEFADLGGAQPTFYVDNLRLVSPSGGDEWDDLDDGSRDWFYGGSWQNWLPSTDVGLEPVTNTGRNPATPAGAAFLRWNVNAGAGNSAYLATNELSDLSNWSNVTSLQADIKLSDPDAPVSVVFVDNDTQTTYTTPTQVAGASDTWQTRTWNLAWPAGFDNTDIDEVRFVVNNLTQNPTGTMFLDNIWLETEGTTNPPPTTNPADPTNFHQFGSNVFSTWVPGGSGAFVVKDETGLPQNVAIDFATAESSDAALLRLTYDSLADWTGISDNINFGLELANDDRVRIRVIDSQGGSLVRDFSGLDTQNPVVVTLPKSEVDAALDLSQILIVETWFFGQGRAVWQVGGTGTTPPTPTLSPEIDLRSANNVPISDGDTSPSVTDGTDFGSVAVDNGIMVKTFNILNTGTAPLDLTGSPNQVLIGGTHAADFTVVDQPITPIAPGSSASFTVLFDPSAAGLRQASLQIANNDSNENPYDFAIHGTGTVVVDPDPPASAGTDFLQLGDGVFSVWVPAGNGAFVNLDQSQLPDEVSIDYATPDSSEAALLRLTYNNPSNWTNISDPVNFGVELGNDDRLRIRVLDANGGMYLEEFSGLDTQNPINVGVAKSALDAVLDLSQITRVETWYYGDGTASWHVGGSDAPPTPTPTPEMDVRGLANLIIGDGDTTPSATDGTDLGSLSVDGATTTQTFNIVNTGTAVLNLTASPRVIVSGTHASDFTVIQQPSGSVAPGGSAPFIVRFDPSGEGLRQAALQIPNNDSNENPYDFAIQGTGTVVVDPPVSGSTDFLQFGNGSFSVWVPPGGGAFANLNQSGLPDDVSIQYDTATNSEAALLRLTYDSPANWTNISDPVNFGVELANDDRLRVRVIDGNGALYLEEFSGLDTQNPINVAIPKSALDAVLDLGQITRVETWYYGQGTAVWNVGGSTVTPPPTPSGPEISITGTDDIVIVDGDSTPAVADGTDLGSLLINDQTVQTFTVRNLGDEPLNLTASPDQVVVSGIHAGDFTVIQQPTTPIQPGGSAPITVLFEPSSLGLRQATLLIASDDVDENPYDFAIQGTGTPPEPTFPEIEVVGLNDTDISDGDTTPSFADGTDFGGFDVDGEVTERTFDIRNTGNAPLILTGSPARVVVNGANAAEFVVVEQPSASIAPGGSSSFTIQFNPAALGPRTASVQILHTDVDENPFDFVIQGTGTTDRVPEINITGEGGLTIVDGDTTPALADGTDFGSFDIDSGVNIRNFRIQNIGTATLNLTGNPDLVTITGPHASDFSIFQSPSTPVPVGDSVTFTVLFDPSAVGLRQATIQIPNTDADETPYNFAIQGTGTFTPLVPEINVTGLANLPIVDGDTTPTLADGTDFGSFDVDSGLTLRHFDIHNTGTAALDLTGNGVFLTGPHAADFSIVQQPSSPIEVGTTARFTVFFDPSAPGLRQATIQIPNNDLDENPFDFAIQGTGTVQLQLPEINITGNSGLTIVDGDATPSVVDGTDFGSLDVDDGVAIGNFTIHNTGTAPLNLTGSPDEVLITGLHASDFTVFQQPSTPIPVGGSAPFSILFDPSGVGLRQATILISNTDVSENPYNFAIQGTGTLVSALMPEINVSGDFNLPIADGDLSPNATDGTDFGSLDINGGIAISQFTIQNAGTAPLTLLGSPNQVLITGPHASDFTVFQQPSSSIAAGGSVTFTVLFEPSTVGLRQATIQIANNDLDENPYDFAIQGIGTSDSPTLTPEINVLGKSDISILDGDTTPSLVDGTDFGSLDINAGFSVETFQIQNLGSVPLNLTNTPQVVLTGPHASDFTVVQPSTPIAAGGSASFFVLFDPSGVGLRQATIQIANNDVNENPYDFFVQGIGTSTQPSLLPEINVTGENDVTILDGDTTPSSVDGTDFLDVDINSGFALETYTIHNDGSQALNLTSSPRVSITGAHASDFFVVSPPASPIAPGTSASFVVAFDPSAVGVRQATIQIANNDSDENPYDFAIQGNGTTTQPTLQPEMDVFGNGNVAIVDGDVSPSASEGTDFGSTDVTGGLTIQTYTIFNNGVASLELSDAPNAVVLTGPHASDFTVFQQPTSPIPIGSSTTFAVFFDPSGVGTRQATIQIANNDANENPYNFAIQGVGTGQGPTQQPEIEVTGENGIEVADGDTTPALADGTDLGSLNINGAIGLQEFDIHNTGDAPLNLTGSPDQVVITGTHASDFAIVTQPTGTIQPGASATFIVLFDPSATGVRQANIEIANDDIDENPYNFAIQGTGTTNQPGTVPEINVTGLSGLTIPDGDTTPSVVDGTDFGGLDVTTGINSQLFTISNLGTGPLNLTGTAGQVTIVGVHASDFTVIQQPASSIPVGSSAAFEIQFNPSGIGLRQATLQIANNDPDENPYDFVIQGTGTSTQPAPGADITVSASLNGVQIVDGDQSPSAQEGTDFGVVDTFNEVAQSTFFIGNVGTEALQLTGNPRVSIVGPHAGDFQVVLQPSTLVPVGANVAFTVLFNPISAGLREATIQIASTDGDENPFDFAIQGIGLSTQTNLLPDIQVSGTGSNVVEDGDLTPETTNGTDFGTVDVNGAGASRTFAITNAGSAALELTGSNRVSIEGLHAADFSVFSQPISPINPGATVTFTLVFNPTASGVRQATVRIDTNDPDENPFDFVIQGTGTASAPTFPEIGVTDVVGNSVLDGDLTPDTGNNTDFGSLDIDGGVTLRSYTIFNTGSDPLVLNGNPNAVAITGAHAADFSIFQAPTSPVPVGGSTSFAILFDPSATGLRQAEVSIPNNDSDESPYNFAIQGTGTSSQVVQATNFNQFGTNQFSSVVPTGGTVSRDESQLPNQVSINYSTAAATDAALLRLTYDSAANWNGISDAVHFGVDLGDDDRFLIRVQDNNGGQYLEAFSGLATQSPVSVSVTKANLDSQLDLSAISVVETWFYGQGTGVWFVGGNIS